VFDLELVLLSGANVSSCYAANSASFLFVVLVYHCLSTLFMSWIPNHAQNRLGCTESNKSKISISHIQKLKHVIVFCNRTFKTFFSLLKMLSLFGPLQTMDDMWKTIGSYILTSLMTTLFIVISFITHY